ncbi:hypothetical protein P8452_31925 [Trifolium repens]|nr:hypothetical protein P8452_31925 [Trifolium repens]
MREVHHPDEVEYFRSELALLQFSDTNFKSPLSSEIFINIHDEPTTSFGTESDSSISSSQSEQVEENEQHVHPKDEWLPITELRNGNAYFAAFHILNSNIGFQALMLPVAFATLGWEWGSVCLSIAFIWQLYTIFPLIEFHESTSEKRHSRYLFLAMSAFGERLGKVAALFPIMYQSGGTCVILIITGGGTMKQLFKILCINDNGVETCSAPSLGGVEWFLVFICVAILVAQSPNLNSVVAISFVGAVASITYCTLFWSLSVKKGRPKGVSYNTKLVSQESIVVKISDIMNAIGIIVLAFRGHNVVLEIQGTLPSNFRETSKEPMRRGVIISYILIAMCLFPLAIAGFWAYGNQIPD